jgi:hypothetical protein
VPRLILALKCCLTVARVINIDMSRRESLRRCDYLGRERYRKKFCEWGVQEQHHIEAGVEIGCGCFRFEKILNQRSDRERDEMFVLRVSRGIHLRMN